MTRKLAWLGWRLGTQRGYDARLRMVLLGFAVMFVTFLILAAVAVPGAIKTQTERNYSLSLEIGENDSGVLGREKIYDRRWDGYEVKRILFAIDDPTGNGIAIPGIDSFPGLNEVYVSPQLTRLIETNPTIRALFSSNRIVGQINNEGLIHPNELRAIIGVPSQSRGLEPVKQIGTKPAIDDLYQQAIKDFNTRLLWLVAVLVMIPALALVVLGARLGSRQRQQRIQAFRRLGLARWQVRMVMVVETALIAIPSILFAIVLYNVLIRIVDHVPGTEFGFFTDDVLLSVPQIFVVALSVFLLVILAAAVGVKIEQDHVSVSKISKLSLNKKAPYGVVVLGIVILFSSDAINSEISILIMWFGVAFMLVGLGFAASPFVSSMSRLISHWVDRGGLLLGLRLNSGEPGTTARMTALIAMFTMSLIIAINFLTLFSLDFNARVSGNVSNEVLVRVSDYSGTLTLDEVSKTRGVKKALPTVDLIGNKNDFSVVTVSCKELEEFLVKTLNDCSNSELSWLSKSGSSPETVESNKAELTPGVVIDLPESQNAITVSITDLMDGYLFAPTLASSLGNAQADGYLIRISANNYSEVLASLASIDPGAGFNFGEQAFFDTDTQELRTQHALLLIGAVLASVVAWFGLLISSTGETSARRDRLRTLYVLGCKRRDLIYSHFASNALPLIFMTVLAMLLSALVDLRIMVFEADRPMQGIGMWGVFIVVGSLVAILTAALTLPSSIRSLGPNQAQAD